jgi:hydrogenase/urease accessory protein HupE
MTRACASLCLLLCAWLVTAPASAHAVGLSRGEYRWVSGGLEARLVFDRADLGADSSVFNSSAWRAEVERRIVQNVRVLGRDGTRCPGRLRELEPTDDGGTALDAFYACAGEPDAANVVIEFWDELAPGHRHLATSADAGAAPAAARERLLYRDQPRLELSPLPVTPRLSAFDWIRLGVEHILGGYDHLLFLLALVVVTPALRPLWATVSLFTIAHSVTLAISTLQVFAPPPSLVECAIALSITYVGLENLTSRASRPRYLVVFGFGLIHGFGFAGALAELGLPQAQTPGALLGFNVGVELGQVGLLGLAFPIIHWLRRSEWFGPRGVPALSIGTALAGMFWFLQRM